MEKKLEFTESAKNQIDKITKSEEKKYFRIAVLGGGCSGFKYSFSFDDKIEKDDIFIILKLLKNMDEIDHGHIL